MKKIKQIVLTFLLCSSIVYLCACGSNHSNGGASKGKANEIEMSGKEALNMLSLTYKSASVKKANYAFASGLEDKGWFDITFVFDINLKDEYKNDYELAKILTIDYDSFTNENKAHPSYIEIDREKKQVVVCVYGYVDRDFNPFGGMRNRFGSIDLDLATSNTNIKISDYYGNTSSLSSENLKRLIEWTINYKRWDPNKEIDLRINNIHLRLYEKK